MKGLDVLETVSVAPGLRDRQTAAGHVVESLRSAIQRGTLEDGTELNQVALAEHFGISRVPVREAMRALQAEGWITALPHRRAVVQAVSLERVEEIFDVRALLETHLLDKAIGRIDVSRIAALYGICDTMDAMREHHDWVAANRRFHRELLDAAGAPMTMEMIDQLTSQVERYLRAGGGDVIRETEAGDEHRAIIAAIARGAASDACALLRAHIDHTRRRVITTMSDRSRTARQQMETT